ncbi:MAG: AsnC family transcriptional regulator [Candidatus Bathyarchaeota archaeon]|uniref:siroheme decarboxylase subunit alpha n=1 Tax=Candidatus Bathycorpusculum sp. TaxID=2994959 RepID=UPI00283664C9|nr:AsnC family transcriptional regulator [Candidatus Termiticorpusculum sp.]MCL2257508.1 AsnC family transcriptional regulator [Candidatus Termiticorpusculum sp.]MCL2292350.1 AsnC family transcriptional regulator [Candidatus Termiticorpusculum sp.]
MTSKLPLDEGSKKVQTYLLDDIDKQLLQFLQDDFPLVESPWSEIGNKLGMYEDQIVTRIEKLFAVGVIRKIGPIVNLSKIGYQSTTLVALCVPENQVDNVASIINQYSNISHNYERAHKYNVWFTLAAKSEEELTYTLNEILQKTGVNQNDVLNLHTIQRFKINVNFKLKNNDV